MAQSIKLSGDKYWDTSGLYGGRIMNYLGYIDKNASQTFTVPDSSRGMLLVQRGSDTTGVHGLYSILSTNTGAVYCSPLFAAASITVTKATNSVTLANAGNAIYISWIGNNLIS